LSKINTSEPEATTKKKKTPENLCNGSAFYIAFSSEKTKNNNTNKKETESGFRVSREADVHVQMAGCALSHDHERKDKMNRQREIINTDTVLNICMLVICLKCD